MSWEGDDVTEVRYSASRSYIEERGGVTVGRNLGALSKLASRCDARQR